MDEENCDDIVWDDPLWSNQLNQTSVIEYFRSSIFFPTPGIDSSKFLYN